MKPWFRRLAVRVTAAIAVAIVAAKLSFTILPKWAFPFVNVLNWPIEWVWSWFYPTWDTNLPFIPFEGWRAFWALMLFAIPVYTALLYVPNIATWLVRTTRAALRLPWEFFVYLVAGGVLGGMLGTSLWTASHHIRSRPALYVFAVSYAVSVGWAMAVGRFYVSLWRREHRSA